MNLQVQLQNAATSAGLSGWTCQFIWNGGSSTTNGVSPGTTGTIAESVVNTAASGNCVTTANSYYAGWSLLIRVCHQATACTTASYAQQEFVAVVPLPGGTVPFYSGTQAPTAQWTQQFVLKIVPDAGDIAATNTPVVMTFQSQNGTVIATGKSCYTNLNNGNGGLNCSFGTGFYVNSFTITLTNTYSTSTFPFTAGYTPFPSDPILAIPGVNSFSTSLQLEVKQTGGTNAICTVGGSGFPNGQPNGITKSSATPDVIYASNDLSAALTVNKVNGYQTVSTGVTQLTFTANCQTLTAGAHADTDTFTFNLYTYYSLPWVQSNAGNLNTQTAVTQMSQYVITMTS